VIGLFRYLNYGLAAILGFIGIKLVLHDVTHIPTGLSLGVICSILVLATLASILIPKKPGEEDTNHG